MSFRAVLEFRNVSHRFIRWGQEVTALREVNLRIEQGEWVMVTGPNGSGKSTLLRLASGLIPFQSGGVELLGQSIASFSSARLAKSVFYVHQDPLLGTAPQLTVFENLSISDPGAAGRTRRVLEGKYGDLLATYSLHDRLRQPAGSLSGGERQLLTLLIAGLRPCELILLDEPFAALDPARASIAHEILQRLNEQGRTLVQVTHDRGALRGHSGRVVQMIDGSVVNETDPAVTAARG